MSEDLFGHAGFDQAPPPETFDVPRGPEPLADDYCGVDPCACPQPEPEAPAFAAPPLAPVAERLPGASALDTFRERRVELLEKHGDRACVTLDHTPRELVLRAQERLNAVLERVGGRNTPSVENLEIALATTATIGAIAAALFDRISTDLRRAGDVR